MDYFGRLGDTYLATDLREFHLSDCDTARNKFTRVSGSPTPEIFKTICGAAIKLRTMTHQNLDVYERCITAFIEKIIVKGGYHENIIPTLIDYTPVLIDLNALDTVTLINVYAATTRRTGVFPADFHIRQGMFSQHVDDIFYWTVHGDPIRTKRLPADGQEPNRFVNYLASCTCNGVAEDSKLDELTTHDLLKLSLMPPDELKSSLLSMKNKMDQYFAIMVRNQSDNAPLWGILFRYRAEARHNRVLYEPDHHN